MLGNALSWAPRLDAHRPRLTAHICAVAGPHAGKRRQALGLVRGVAQLPCAGERYHAFLRDLFQRVRAVHPTVDKEHALAWAVWTMNQTAGTHGLVLSLLVFGVLPRLPVAPTALPAQRERMLAVHTARAALLQHMARSRVLRALRSRVLAAADADIRAGGSVLVYREPPMDKWEGPYAVVATDGKQVWLLVRGRPKQFAIDKVNP